MAESKHDTPVAAPKYSVGQAVRYHDRQDRLQTGEITRIEASWSSWSREPLVIYSLYHPTYRSNNFYTTDERIYGAAS